MFDVKFKHTGHGEWSFEIWVGSLCIASRAVGQDGCSMSFLDATNEAHRWMQHSDLNLEQQARRQQAVAEPRW